MIITDGKQKKEIFIKRKSENYQFDHAADIMVDDTTRFNEDGELVVQDVDYAVRQMQSLETGTADFVDEQPEPGEFSVEVYDFE